MEEAQSQAEEAENRVKEAEQAKEQARIRAEQAKEQARVRAERAEEQARVQAEQAEEQAKTEGLLRLQAQKMEELLRLQTQKMEEQLRLQAEAEQQRRGEMRRQDILNLVAVRHNPTLQDGLHVQEYLTTVTDDQQFKKIFEAIVRAETFEQFQHLIEVPAIEAEPVTLEQSA